MSLSLIICVQITCHFERERERERDGGRGEGKNDFFHYMLTYPIGDLVSLEYCLL